MLSPKARLIVIIVTTLLFAATGATGIYFAAKALASKCTSGYTYNKDLKECVPACDDGEIYYDSMKACSKCPPGQTFSKGKCIAVECPVSQEVCGVDCYDKASASCINDQICPKEENCRHEYTDSSGDKQCCKNCVGTKTVYKTPTPTPPGQGTKVDDCCEKNHYVGKDGTCVPCDDSHVTCGETCCDSNKMCCKGQCCPIGEVCDESGKCCAEENLNTKTKLCCVYEGGGTSSNRCCAEGEVAKDGICKIPCPKSPTPGKNYKDYSTVPNATWCESGKFWYLPSPEYGCTQQRTCHELPQFLNNACPETVTQPQDFCDPNAEHPEYCETVKLGNGASRSGCTKRTCDAEVEFAPDPANLYPPDKELNAGIPVGVDNQGKNWFCKGSQTPALAGLRRTVSTKLNPGECTELDCWGVLKPETGAMFDNYDKSTGNCIATIDCSENINTSADCTKLLAEDGEPGWETSLLNMQAESGNQAIVDNRGVICLDDKNKPTGQICPDYKICDSYGECLPQYLIQTEGDHEFPSKVSCIPVTPDNMTSVAPKFVTKDACVAALKDIKCAKGFARAGTKEDELECYRYGFPAGWSPRAGCDDYGEGQPCQLAKFQSDANMMVTDGETEGLTHCSTWCSDAGTKVPYNAYYCMWDVPKTRNFDRTHMKWVQCTDQNGCKMSENPDDKYGMRYAYNHGRSGDPDWSIGFCSDPGFGVSPTNIAHPDI